MSAHIAIWSICALAALAILIRPWGWAEAVWAVAAALLLVTFSLLPWHQALHAVAQGVDVYLFLAGMMLLAELARTEGLFDWLAAVATRAARGSAERLFVLIYLVGTVVTILLSNDATAVVLTPAVYAASRRARAEPLPLLFVCAFIANAASFVLPISNPANLVVFGNHLPALGPWLSRFLLPSAVSILVTFVALWLTQRRALIAPIAVHVPLPALAPGGRLAAAAIAATALVLLVANALGRPLGAPTFVAGVLAATIGLARARRTPWRLLAAVHWSILPLVAGLFVLVSGLDQTGLLHTISSALQAYAHQAARWTAWCAGVGVAFAANGLNNLPVALIARYTAASAPDDPALGNALLIGVDLGPNLAVTGSLATILWLSVLRREGQHVSAMSFLRLGVLVMPPALLLALASALLR
jgi:arsenical pump membrane protein